MTRERTQILVAAGDLACALSAFACGLFDATGWTLGLAATASVVYWSASRQRALARLRGALWASQALPALAVVIAIQAGAYWLGLNATGALRP